MNRWISEEHQKKLSVKCKNSKYLGLAHGPVVWYNIPMNENTEELQMKVFVKNGTIVSETGQYQGDLCIENGVISQIGTHLEPASEEEAQVIDAAGKYVLPGGVDVHTHMDLLAGSSRAVDDFYDGTVAAACGGTTSIVDHMAFGPAGCPLHHQLNEYQINAVADMIAKQVEEATHAVNVEDIQDMLRSEHGGLNETFADVAAITGDKRYLKLAHQFSHHTVLQLLLRQEDKLTGMHANTQIPKVIGFKRIADLEGNRDWSEAARYFWETVVNHRSITIGGNSVREHFHPADDFSSMLTSEQGPETCNTYNMLRLTKMLYETSADVHFMDYYERALYNHILSTQDPVQGGFVYFTPMRAGHYRVYSQPQTSFWCCVGSGMENHARYGEMIYGHKDNNLYVNLFIPSTLRWGDTQIEQQTAFPDEEGSTLVISPEKGKKEFTLLFRIPEWTKPEALRLSVNGKRQNVTVKEGYVSLNRTWSKGDKVRLELPMHLRAIALPDGSANYSILYGPIVLAARLGKQNQDGMFADDSRGGHIAAGPRLPLQTMPVIVGDKNNLLSHLKKVEGKPLTFTLSGVYPERYEGMTVEPFFRLYECRYMVYWPVLSVQELQARQEQLAKEEKERAALDGMTADKVICGEQQPESDHFIRMENSRTGDDEGVHWREAAGWFSYRMKTNGKQVNKVRIRFRSEIRKDAKVWINGQEVGRLAGKPASDVSVGIFDVPASMQSNEQLEIKIGKGNEKVTPHIYEVRLVAE